jgi:hypothetical protein
MLITYEPRSLDVDYSVFVKTLGSLGTMQPCFRATWTLQTSQATAGVFDSLHSALGVDDGLLVVDLTSGSAAWVGLDTETSNRLREALS